MAVSKIWPVTHNLGYALRYAANPEKTAGDVLSNEQLQALQDVLAYAKNEEKTEREFYVHGIHCNADTARSQFITVKKQFDKLDGIQAYHGYLSFRENEVTPEQALQVGTEFAQRAWGDRFQVLVTVHLNTKHLHCHFVVNSVSFADGKRLHGEEKAWFKLRKLADEICIKHGLSIVEKPSRSRKSEYLTHMEEAGMPTRYDMVRKAIDEAVAQSSTLMEFSYVLRQMGYTYNLSPTRKYWTVTPKGYTKPIRLNRLGEDYSNARIQERLDDNIGKVLLKPFHKGSKPQYRLPTRIILLRRRGGLYGLYLHYCYRLGVLPDYGRKNPNHLPPSLRKDLLELDRFTQGVRLLGRMHIDTTEQLTQYREQLEAELSLVMDDRNDARRFYRRKLSEEDKAAVKEVIVQQTDKCRHLRKEIALCKDITQRSKSMETVLAEESQQRKYLHEQQR